MNPSRTRLLRLALGGAVAGFALSLPMADPATTNAAGACHKVQYTIKVGSYGEDLSDGDPASSLTVRNELVLRWCESSNGGFRAVRKSCYFKKFGFVFKDSEEVTIRTSKFRRDLRESGCGVRAITQIGGKFGGKECQASVRVRYRPDGTVKSYPSTKACNSSGFTARVTKTG